MLIIFDCDGVLIDSEIIYCSVDSAALARLGHTVEPVEIARRFTGIQSQEMWPILASELGFTIPANLLEETRAEYARRCEQELLPIAGVRKAVQLLTGLGHSVCVASSTAPSPLEANLRRVGLWELFDPHVYSVAQVKRGKPAPDVFLYAASQSGFDPSDCIIVEDSVAGVTGARRAGMNAIGFTGARHADKDLSARLRAAGAKHVFDSLPNLASWLSTSLSEPSAFARV